MLEIPMCSFYLQKLSLWNGWPFLYYAGSRISVFCFYFWWYVNWLTLRLLSVASLNRALNSEILVLREGLDQGFVFLPLFQGTCYLGSHVDGEWASMMRWHHRTIMRHMWMLVKESHLLKKVCMKELRGVRGEDMEKNIHTDAQRYCKYSGMQAVLEKSNSC